MYAVNVYIYTDGDFGYKDAEFGDLEGREVMFYFENRKDAAKALVKSFQNLKTSFYSSKGCDNIKEWLEYMANKVELITNKVPTFLIHRDFGNQSITYELIEAEKITIQNGSYYFINWCPKIYFSNYMIEQIDWNELAKEPDVEEV